MTEKIHYLTLEGFQQYKEEYKKLTETFKKSRSKMKEIRDELWRPEDLNPDYEPIESELISAKIRLKELENILKNSKIIRKPRHSSMKVVTIGSTILVEVDNQIDELTIVDTLEANPAVGKISNESPIGKALLGHRVGDEVVISSPIKTIYKIKKIKYLSS